MVRRQEVLLCAVGFAVVVAIAVFLFVWHYTHDVHPQVVGAPASMPI